MKKTKMTLVIVALIAILAVFITFLFCSKKGDGSSSADENPQGLQFYPQGDGTYVVSRGDAKYLSNIVIPATYKGGAVMGIDNNAFDGCINLTSIEIPDSVTSIGNAAFADCSSLTDVYYTGTDEEWAKIYIDYSNNWYLTDATIHYNYVPAN